jgi:uncharacterized membrane protein YecN with MAPEG domain
MRVTGKAYDAAGPRQAKPRRKHLAAQAAIIANHLHMNMPMTNAVDLIVLLSLLQFFVFGGLVGRARGKYGVKAPAITGHEMFERAYRVQMNTLELLVLLLPALYLAAKHWSPSYAAIAGAVYLVGRVVYWRAYMQSPDSRGLGFALSMAPILVLIIASLVGIARST